MGRAEPVGGVNNSSPLAKPSKPSSTCAAGALSAFAAVAEGVSAAEDDPRLDSGVPWRRTAAASSIAGEA